MKLYCEHRIDKGADDLWRVLHTEDFESHLGRAIGLSEYRELERNEDENAIYRKIRVIPTIPAAFSSLLRYTRTEESVSYIERQWRSKQEMEVRWEMEPSILADRVQIDGVILIKPISARTCLRILDGQVKVDVPGLATVIERAVVSSAIDAYDKSAIAAGVYVPKSVAASTLAEGLKRPSPTTRKRRRAAG
jgi:hypothetical protein